MAPEVAEVLATVKSLPRDQIADLAYQVLRVLDEEPDSDAVAIDEAWQAEFRRRVDALENGRTVPVSHDETVAAARAMLADRRK